MLASLSAQRLPAALAAPSPASIVNGVISPVTAKHRYNQQLSHSQQPSHNLGAVVKGYTQASTVRLLAIQRRSVSERPSYAPHSTAAICALTQYRETNDNAL